MSQFSQILPKDLLKALIKLGFLELHQKGSHMRLIHPDGRKITLAIHSKSLPKGTFGAILRQAKISRKEIKEVLKKKR